MNFSNKIESIRRNKGKIIYPRYLILIQFIDYIMNILSSFSEI